MAVSDEVYYSGENQKVTYAYENQPESAYETLREVFPWVKKENYFSISNPAYHEVLDEMVVTCCLPLIQSESLVGPQTALTSRKFCMESGTSFLRSYELYTGERPEWLPDEADLFGWGVNHREYNRPFPEVAATFTDFYFGGEPAAIEAHFDLPEKRGDFDTWYGVTVVDGAVARVKQYCYDSENTFSNWEGAYLSVLDRLAEQGA